MLDIQTHRRIMLQILKDIYTDKTIGSLLGFKGGTCLYFFHRLSRFSTDLDFNLVVPKSSSQRHLTARINKILKQHVTIQDYTEKRSTYFWLTSYSKGANKIKVEISKRAYNDEYEFNDLFGIPIILMKKEYMFAHKLCAISDRSRIVSRDLYDAWFMFEKRFDIAHHIIKSRTAMETREYFEFLVDYLGQNFDPNEILQGLGEVLDTRTKDWAKAKLLTELNFYLKSYNE